MKILKYFFLGILGIVALFVIVGMIAPNDFKVEKSITIDAPASEIHPYVSNLRLQNEWSIWAEMDPDQKETYEGTDGAPGSKHSWEGEITGKGYQEIVSVTPARIETNLVFTAPYESQADVYFDLKESGSSTEVTWGFKSEMPFPMNIFLIFGDMGVGDDFQKGLENLKAKVENS